MNQEIDYTQLYKKVGKRYVPVQKNDSWEYFKNGFYLAYINEGGSSFYTRVFPDRIELQSAYKSKTEEIARIISNGVKMRPARKTVSKKQRAAWLEFEKVMGKDGYCVEYGAIQEIVDNIEKVIMDTKENYK